MGYIVDDLRFFLESIKALIFGHSSQKAASFSIKGKLQINSAIRVIFFLN